MGFYLQHFSYTVYLYYTVLAVNKAWLAYINEYVLWQQNMAS